MHLSVTDSDRRASTQSDRFGRCNVAMPDKPPNKEFGARFKRLAREAGYATTQAEIARVLSCSKTTAWNYLNGDKLPAMDNAVKVAEVLGCCVEYLLTGRGPKRPPCDSVTIQGAELLNHSNVQIAQALVNNLLAMQESQPQTQGTIRRPAGKTPIY